MVRMKAPDDTHPDIYSFGASSRSLVAVRRALRGLSDLHEIKRERTNFYNLSI